MPISKYVVFVMVMVTSILAFGCGASPSREPLAVIEKITKGEAFLQRSGEPAFQKAEGRESLFAGDTVRTADGAEVVIRFATGAVTRVLPGSEFELKERKLAQADQQKVFTRLVKGMAAFYVPKNAENAKKFEVETERAVASIKGTIFKIRHLDNVTTLTVSEGTVTFSSKVSGKAIDVAEFFAVTADDRGLGNPEKVNTLEDPDLSGDLPIIPGSRN